MGDTTDLDARQHVVDYDSDLHESLSVSSMSHSSENHFNYDRLQCLRKAAQMAYAAYRPRFKPEVPRGSMSCAGEWCRYLLEWPPVV